MKLSIGVIADALAEDGLVVQVMQRDPAPEARVSPGFSVRTPEPLSIGSVHVFSPPVPDAPYGASELVVTSERDLGAALAAGVAALVVACDEAAALERVCRAARTSGVAGCIAVFDAVGPVCTAERLASCVARLFERLDAWDGRMLEALLERGDRTEVLAIGSEMLKNPVALFDSTFTLLGYTGEFPEELQASIWDDVLEKGYMPLGKIARETRALMSHTWMRAEDALVYEPHQYPGTRNLVVDIEVDGEVCGILGLVDLNAPFSAGQISLAFHVGRRLGQLFGLSRDSHPVASDPVQCLLRVLEGDPSLTRQAAARLVSLHRGWRLDDAFQLAAFELADVGHVAEASCVAPLLQRALPHALICTYGDAVVALIRQGDGEPDARSQLEAFDFGALGEDARLCGLSDPFTGFLDARRAYSQAAAAIEAGRSRGLEGVVSFGEVFGVHLLHGLRGLEPCAVLYHPLVVRIIRELSTEAHARSRLRDIAVYLTCGCNAAKAAKRLFMHRNSFEYHVNRIEKRWGVSLSELDEDEHFRLLFSCRLALEEGELLA